MSDEGKVIVRPVNLNDKNYFMSSWLHNQYHSSQYYFAYMPQDLFFKEYTKYIAQLLFNPDCKIDVAVLETDPDMILGFVCYFPDTIHWCYVKNKYRGKGIAKLLLEGKTFHSYTGSTAAGHMIANKMSLTFNPFIT